MVDKSLKITKKTIEKYQESLRKGKRVIKLINEYEPRLEKLKTLLGRKEGSLNSIQKKSKELIVKLQGNNDQSQTILQEIQSINEKAKTLGDSQVNFNKKVDEFSSQLSESQDEIVQKKGETLTTVNEINELKNQSIEKVQEINKKFTESNELEQKYVDLLEKLNHPDTGIKSNINISTQKKNEIETIKEEVNKFFDAISELKNKILNSREKSKEVELEINKSKVRVDQYLSESKKNKEEIEDMIHLVSDSSLAAAFRERKKALNVAIIIWGILLIISIAGILYLLWYFIPKTSDSAFQDWQFFLLRFSISTPLAYLAYFSGKQYTFERQLQERYAFKETTSRVHKSHTSFLLKHFAKEEIKSIFTFTKKSSLDILKEPYESRQTKIKVGLGSKIFGKFFEIQGEHGDFSSLANKFLDNKNLVAGLFQKVASKKNKDSETIKKEENKDSNTELKT